MTRQNDGHWLLFSDQHAPFLGPVTGCHCGFQADPYDYGWGNSVVDHISAVKQVKLQTNLDKHINAVEAVLDVLHSAEAFGDEIDPDDILEAIRSKLGDEEL